MQTTDERILYLIDLLIFQKRISSTKQFCEEIKVLEQTVSKIKKGNVRFTVNQIESICKVYNVDANWIFGIEKNMFRNAKAVIK